MRQDENTEIKTKNKLKYLKEDGTFPATSIEGPSK
jgi:hypothetical protein